MTKKEMVQEFLKMSGMGNVHAAYEKFVSGDFIHHNQYTKCDCETLMRDMIAEL